nr:MAG TPA: hypothetical protein [Caudoviricetes sp.]
MKKEYQDLLDTLNEIQENLSQHVDDLESQRVNFNNRLLELMSNYPQLKDIIQFILEVNDNLDNKQKQYFNQNYEAITKLITLKKKLIKQLETDHEAKGILKKLNVFVSSKYAIILILITIFCISLWFQPDQTIQLIKELKGIIGVVK